MVDEPTSRASSWIEAATRCTREDGEHVWEPATDAQLGELLEQGRLLSDRHVSICSACGLARQTPAWRG